MCTELLLHTAIHLPSFPLYKSQVLPLLDYASVVWDPHLKKDKLLLESVQLFATRIASKSWKENSVSLNRRFELSTLEHRRQYFKLLLTYKFLNGYTFCPSGFFVQHPNPNSRLFHSKHLVQPFARTETYFHSFFVDSVKLWIHYPMTGLIALLFYLSKIVLNCHTCLLVNSFLFSPFAYHFCVPSY